MTLTKLKALSDELADDADFLAHRDVRRVYWKALGENGHQMVSHLWANGQETVRCDFCKDGISSDPCLIPGSLADAVERLRERVISGRRKTKARTAVMKIEGSVTGADRWLAFAPARDRFLAFAAAAGGTEGD